MTALESLSDPLIAPVLALCKDAINADLADAMEAAGVTPEDAVRATAPYPFALRIEGAAVLPALHCYRVQSRSTQFSVVHVDHVSRLQFTYATPGIGREGLDERWPLLDRVWRALLGALKSGSHAAHADGADVLSDAGVVKVDLGTTRKLEVFIEDGNHTFPGFIGELDVTWRDGSDVDTGSLYPALSFEAKVFADGVSETGDPDAVSRALTPIGEEELDSEPFEEEAELP